MLPDNVSVKPKHVGVFIVNLNVNFNILKQFNCALVGQIKDLIASPNVHELYVLLPCEVQSKFICIGSGRNT
jgi:hypothetical protein